MKECKIKLYNYNELSQKVRCRLWDKSDLYLGDTYDDDYLGTLNAFEKAFDIKVWKYSVNTIYSPSFQYETAGAAGDCPEGDPLRVAKFVWNNYAKHIMKGKYYSTRGSYVNGKYTYKHRCSKIIKRVNDCTLTGMCYDDFILQPIVDCLHYKKMYKSYEDLINDCLTAFFNAWHDDRYWLESFECFDEYMTDNDDSVYLENGTKIEWEWIA